MRVRLAPQAFPKTLRLLRRAEFRRVYEEGQRRSAPLCTVFFISNGLPESRLGITTPKQLGNAVARNHVRRRLREVFRRHRPQIACGWDIVLNPRPPILKASFEAVTRELLRLFPQQPPKPEPASSAVVTPAKPLRAAPGSATTSGESRNLAPES
jgi:ribonuclease P protein component